MAQSTTVELPVRMTVKDFAKNVYGNIGGVYNLLFHASENGFEKCVRRVGRKIFIDVVEFYKWQDEINGVLNYGA